MRTILLICVALVTVACSTLPRNPVPLEQQSIAEIPNIPDARYWADEPPDNLVAILDELDRQRSDSGIGGDIKFLALSGGADNGAFGAGILNAWTEVGTRPEFTVVTGVSTGALSAPFAFLGPDYDDDLRKMYGGFPRDRIFKIRSLFNILPKASVADTRPLEATIAQFADETMLAAVAREHRKGRRLIVQSTNLDAERPVVWDLGAIADSGAPNALKVFRSALLASASIPVGFAPVLFNVEVEGRQFDEMHADGGIVATATVLSGWQADLSRVAASDADHAPGTLSIYVIRNGRIGPEAEHVPYRLVKIARRSVGTLLKSQGVNSLLTVYAAAKLRDASFRATWIGDDYQHDYPRPFDPDYMKALYQYGYDLMMSGNAWFEEPPVLMTEEQRNAARYPLSGGAVPAQ